MMQRAVALRTHNAPRIKKHSDCFDRVHGRRPRRRSGEESAPLQPQKPARRPGKPGAMQLTKAETGPRDHADAAHTATGTQVCVGATRVGALLTRLRLHLTTSRFLAAHRHDMVWEAGCEYA